MTVSNDYFMTDSNKCSATFVRTVVSKYRLTILIS